MKLIKIWVIVITLGSYLFGGNAYKLVDIGECILPISKKLEKRGAGQHYDEKNYTDLSYPDSYSISNEEMAKINADPIGISIEKNDEKMASVNAKAKQILGLDKKITIAGFEVFTDNKKTNSNKLVYLKDYVLLLGNYPFNDLRYMLSYCKKTSKIH